MERGGREGKEGEGGRGRRGREREEGEREGGGLNPISYSLLACNNKPPHTHYCLTVCVIILLEFLVN